MKLVTSLLRQYVNSNQDNWVQLLPAVEFAINHVPGPSGFSQFEIVYAGHRPRSAAGRLVEQALQHDAPNARRSPLARQRLSQYARIIAQVRAWKHKAREAMLAGRMTTRRQQRLERFDVGDYVLLRREQ